MLLEVDCLICSDLDQKRFILYFGVGKDIKAPSAGYFVDTLGSTYRFNNWCILNRHVRQWPDEMKKLTYRLAFGMLRIGRIWSRSCLAPGAIRWHLPPPPFPPQKSLIETLFWLRSSLISLDLGLLSAYNYTKNRHGEKKIVNNNTFLSLSSFLHIKAQAALNNHTHKPPPPPPPPARIYVVLPFPPDVAPAAGGTGFSSVTAHLPHSYQIA